MHDTTTLDPEARARAYFDAWRRRDAQAVLATMAPGGTYEDPVTGGPIAGEAFAGYMQALWSAFPDLDFSVSEMARVGERRVHSTWQMHGRNDGSFRGLPPTGRSISLPGVDVIEVGDEGMRSVRGYFDSAAVPRQLGLDVIVQASQIGPFNFGSSTVVRRDVHVQPAVLVFTELIARGSAQVQPIRDLARQTVIEQWGNPAFLGATTSIAGLRMTTVSGWSSHEAMSQAMQAGTHAQAVQQFFREGIAEGGHTAVYAAVRTGPAWRRCGGCGVMSRLDDVQGQCQACGTSISALA